MAEILAESTAMVRVDRIEPQVVVAALLLLRTIIYTPKLAIRVYPSPAPNRVTIWTFEYFGLVDTISLFASRFCILGRFYAPSNPPAYITPKLNNFHSPKFYLREVIPQHQPTTPCLCRSAGLSTRRPVCREAQKSPSSRRCIISTGTRRTC